MKLQEEPAVETSLSLLAIRIYLLPATTFSSHLISWHQKTVAPTTMTCNTYSVTHFLSLSSGSAHTRSHLQCRGCSCTNSSTLLSQHRSFCSALLRREANLGPRLEVAGLLDGGEKPADILVPAWDGGRDLCVDVSIVSPFVAQGAGLESGEAARRAEDRKVSRYEASCLANGLIFEPFIMESLGGFGGKADRLLRTLAARWAEAKGMEPPAALSILRQKLSFVSQKALADGFLLRND